MFERDTTLGTIRFSEDVVMKIISKAVESCNGRVSLQNYRGRYKSVIPGSENVILDETAEGLDIAVYVVVRFGSSIRNNAEKIIGEIREWMEAVMGEKPHSVKVIVTGVQSRVIARRHIVISG